MDERDWTDRPLAPETPIVLGDLTVTMLPQAGSTYLVSGKMDEVVGAFGLDNGIICLLETQPNAGSFGIRTGRNSALIIYPDAHELVPGWHPAGFAVSAAFETYETILLSGPGSAMALAQGGVADINATSKSAMLRFAGVSVLLTQGENGYLLWVPKAQLTYMTSFLSGRN